MLRQMAQNAKLALLPSPHQPRRLKMLRQMTQSAKGAEIPQKKASENKKKKEQGECVLVFPKAFEEKQFLASLCDLGFIIQENREGKFTFNYIHWETIGGALSVQTTSFDKSDVLFAGSLVELIRAKETDKNELDLILCGTCGGGPKEKIGACFEISEAIKIDRGDMYLNNGTISVIPRASMRASQKSSRRSFHPSAVAVCSNYLMHMQPTQLYSDATKSELLEGQRILADMETFEFFMICDRMGIEHFSALRVVSDTTYEDPSKTKEESKLEKREIRKNIPMQGLVIMLNKVLGERLSTGGTYTYPKFLKDQIVASSRVRFLDVSRPNFDRAVKYYGADRVAYHKKVDRDWVDDGAFEDFKKKLEESRKTYEALPSVVKFRTVQEALLNFKTSQPTIETEASITADFDLKAGNIPVQRPNMPSLILTRPAGPDV